MFRINCQWTMQTNDMRLSEQFWQSDIFKSIVLASLTRKLIEGDNSTTKPFQYVTCYCANFSYIYCKIYNKYFNNNQYQYKRVCIGYKQVDFVIYAYIPVPTIPTVLPYKSKPIRPCNAKLPSRTRLYPLCMDLTVHNNNATACSATA